MASFTKGKELNISNVKKVPNILQFPIYSIAVFRNFIILGGGGGNEIKNQLIMYELEGSELSTNILKKVVHEEPTGSDVPNFMQVASNVSTRLIC